MNSNQAYGFFGFISRQDDFDVSQDHLDIYPNGSQNDLSWVRFTLRLNLVQDDSSSFAVVVVVVVVVGDSETGSLDVLDVLALTANRERLVRATTIGHFHRSFNHLGLLQKDVKYEGK